MILLTDALLAVFVLLTVWDIHSTSEVLKRGGYERNDFLAPIFAAAFGRWQHAGRFWTLVALKGTFLAFIIHEHSAARGTEAWGAFLVAAVAGYAWLAWHNWKAYKEIA